MDRDEVLVKLVEHESIIWKRNHPQFKNVTMKEQAWSRVAYQLGISSESFFAYTQTLAFNHLLFYPHFPVEHQHSVTSFVSSSFPS